MSVKLVRIGSNKVNGVKIYHDLSGAGLKEATAAIEKVEKGEVIDVPLLKGHTEAQAISLFNAEDGYYAVSSEASASDHMDKKVITCQNQSCRKSFRVPNINKKLEVTCPHCKAKFIINPAFPVDFTNQDFRDIFHDIFETDAKTTSNTPKKDPNVVKPSPTPKQKPQPTKTKEQTNSTNATYQCSNPIRVLKFVRYTHANKDLSLQGVGNVIKDAAFVNLSIDGFSVGKLGKEEMTIPLDGNSHQIGINGSIGKYFIPAGTDNYKAFYFNSNISIGSENDPFREALAKYMVNIFRQSSTKKKLRDSNNSNHSVVINIGSDHVRMFYPLIKTSGIKEWSLGGHEEIISYSEMGLPSPKPENMQPSGYWSYIDDYVKEAIQKDSQANVTRKGSSFYCK